MKCNAGPDLARAVINRRQSQDRSGRAWVCTAPRWGRQRDGVRTPALRGRNSTRGWAPPCEPSKRPCTNIGDVHPCSAFPRANLLTALVQPRGVRHRSDAPASSRQLWGQLEAHPLGLHRGQARCQRTQPWLRATVRHRCMGVESGPFGSGRRCRDAPGRRRCTKRLRGRRSCRLHLLHKKPSCQTHAAAPPASPAGRQRPGSRCAAPPASAAPLQGPHARSSLPLAQPVHKRPGLPRNAACISPDPAGTARRRVRAVPCRAMTAAG